MASRWGNANGPESGPKFKLTHYQISRRRRVVKNSPVPIPREERRISSFVLATSGRESGQYYFARRGSSRDAPHKFLRVRARPGKPSGIHWTKLRRILVGAGMIGIARPID
jgi:hypothetical protein